MSGLFPTNCSKLGEEVKTALNEFVYISDILFRFETTASHSAAKFEQ